ncbi:hypothetical protein HDU67_000984 [Dinochytrium kinnereticum]|nr:hypothetical protein HDU67_000984 [Dinochytrium kinnereticum]
MNGIGDDGERVGKGAAWQEDARSDAAKTKKKAVRYVASRYMEAAKTVRKEVKPTTTSEKASLKSTSSAKHTKPIYRNPSSHSTTVPAPKPKNRPDGTVHKSSSLDPHRSAMRTVKESMPSVRRDGRRSPNAEKITPGEGISVVAEMVKRKTSPKGIPKEGFATRLTVKSVVKEGKETVIETDFFQTPVTLESLKETHGDRDTGSGISDTASDTLRSISSVVEAPALKNCTGTSSRSMLTAQQPVDVANRPRKAISPRDKQNPDPQIAPQIKIADSGMMRKRVPTVKTSASSSVHSLKRNDTNITETHPSDRLNRKSSLETLRGDNVSTSSDSLPPTNAFTLRGREPAVPPASFKAAPVADRRGRPPHDVQRVDRDEEKSMVPIDSDAYNGKQLAQPTQTGAGQGLDVPQERLTDEIMIGRARLAQWRFLKARASFAFEKRKEKAETQIFLVWSLLQQRRAERDQLKHEIEMRTRLKELFAQLRSHSLFLDALESASSPFRQRYERLVQHVQAQAQQIHLQGGAVTDTAIAEALRELKDLQTRIEVTDLSCRRLNKTILDATELQQSYEVELLQLQK